jgi:VIT1/CCC1 family predicted Fe2+/Mn2+ transporter
MPKPKQKNISNYLSEIMYGGMDGIVSTFAVVAGFSGAQSNGLASVGIGAVLLFGFANLFADASSMGLGNFLSVRSKNKVSSKKEKAVITSIFTFVSFIVFGIVPLIPFLFFKDNNNVFYISVGFTFIALTLLGTFRSLATKEKFINVVGEVLLIGGVAAIIAYTVGALITSYAGI